MDCPHCGEETLVGARICGSCGRSVTSQPAFRPSASPTRVGLTPVAAVEGDRAISGSPADADRPRLASETAPRAASPPVQTLCRVCLSGFDRRPEDGSAICPACRQAIPDGTADAVQNDVRIHPNAREAPGVDPRRGSEVRRRPASVRSRMGPVVASLGLLLVLSSMGVVVWRTREKDPTSEYFADASAEDARLRIHPSETSVAQFEATTNVTLVRQALRANFGSNLEDVLRLEQRSVQTADVAHVRSEANGAVVDVSSECHVASQTGVVNGNDGRDAEVHPWVGPHATQRLVLAAGADTQVLGEGRPVVGRDVVPCLALGDIGAPTVAVTPGAHWRHGVVLPFLATREGALVADEFPCELTYVGRRIVNGCACIGFRLKGTAPPRVPAALDGMNRIRGTVQAALFFEMETGLLREAHLVGDVEAWSERGRIDERVSITGTLDVRRR